MTQLPGVYGIFDALIRRQVKLHRQKCFQFVGGKDGIYRQIFKNIRFSIGYGITAHRI